MNPTDWREQDGRDGHGHWRTMLIGVQAATEDGTVVLKISGPFIPMLLMFRRIGNGAFHAMLTYHRKDGGVQEPLMRLSRVHPNAVDIGPVVLVSGTGSAMTRSDGQAILEQGDEIRIKVDPPQRASFIVEGLVPPAPPTILTA